MKKIDANSKIGHILKENPDALEAIVSIDPKLEKLRNPLLRKILANRTSIAMASKMVGHAVEEFFQKLKPLGFEIDSATPANAEEHKQVPAFITQLTKEQLVSFDVRDLLASGKDPLTLILDKVKSLDAGQVLKIINTFEPVPLIKMLEKKGFVVYTDNISDDLIETYFYKQKDTESLDATAPVAGSGWGQLVHRFEQKMVKVDVRELEMPLPMHTILGELDTLAADHALFVYHKRIPVFLLPELADRGFEYRVQEISDGEVHLLIFKA